jgi:hypothetical protein
MVCWQLGGEGWRCEGPERVAALVRTSSNRKFPELEMLQLIENIERHPVLVANFRELR